MNELSSLSTWTGDLPALAEQAGIVQTALGFPGEPAGVRLLRYYQSKGCVSRQSDKAGVRGIYGYRQLLETVAVRAMMGDGWSLSKIGEAMAYLDDAGLEQLLMARAAVNLGQNVLPALPSTRSPQAEMSSAEKAMALVAQFKGEVVKASSPLLPMLSHAKVAAKTMSVISPHTLLEYQPAPWLRVQVDQDALAKVSPGVRERIVAEAHALLDSLGNPSLKPQG